MTITERILGWAFYGFAVRYLATQTGWPPMTALIAVLFIMLLAFNLNQPRETPDA